jgi:hypothetical protein
MIGSRLFWQRAVSPKPPLLDVTIFPGRVENPEKTPGKTETRHPEEPVLSTRRILLKDLVSFANWPGLLEIPAKGVQMLRITSA